MDQQTLAFIMQMARALVTLEETAAAQIAQLQKQLAEKKAPPPEPDDA